MNEKHRRLPLVLSTALIAGSLIYMSAFGDQFPQVNAHGVVPPTAGLVDYIPEVSMEEATTIPSDPEYPHQIPELATIAGGSEQMYLDAIARYTELYDFAHPEHVYDPNNPTPDSQNAVALLGGGIGYNLQDPVDADTVVVRGAGNHPYSRNWDEGTDITFTVFANNQGSNNMVSTLSLPANGMGLTGFSPVPSMVIPGVIRTKGETSSLRQTQALERATSFFAKDPKGITVVAVDGVFTQPSDALIANIAKAAEKGVIIVLAPGSPLANHPGIAPYVVIAGSSQYPNGGQDVLLPEQIWGYVNPNDINQVAGSHIPVAEMAAIIQMAQGLRPANARPVPVSEMKTLIQQYGVDPQGNFVHLEAFIDQVAIRYGIIAVPTPTPTNTATATPTATDTETPVPPTDTATPVPPIPTDTATSVPPIPTDTATPVPPTATATPAPAEFKVYLPLVQRMQNLASAVLGLGFK